MLSSAAPFLALAAVPRIEIAPGVLMPAMNFGDQKNHTMAIEQGARGLDTANVYGDPQQREVGNAVRAAIAMGSRAPKSSSPRRSSAARAAAFAALFRALRYA